MRKMRRFGQSTTEYVLFMMLVFVGACAFFTAAQTKLSTYLHLQVNRIK